MLRARIPLAVLTVLGGLSLPSATAHAGGFLFEESVNVFGTQPCGGTGCYTRYLRVADIDGDGDLDILYPNDGGAAQPLVVYENDGAAGFTDVSATAVGGFTGRVRQIGVADVDGDGDLDIHAPDAAGGVGALFVNDGDGVFIDEGDVRLPATGLQVGATRFADFDGDGDHDILVADLGNGGAALVYLNDGTGVFEELADAIPFNVGGDINDVDVFDVDRDFDLDILTNAHFGANRIWINDGSGVFSDDPFSSSGGLHYGPGVCDVDGDGDLDIWIDNQGPNYTERLWINDGAGGFTDATVAQVSGNPNSDDNGIVCADTDSDGDLDAVVVALSTPERLLVNDGAGTFTYQANAFSGPTDSSLWAEMGDLDGDHRLDIVTGQGESGSFLNRVFLGTVAVPTDTTAPRFLAVEPPPSRVTPGDTVVLRFAVSDDAHSDGGPRLSAAYVIVDPDGDAVNVPAVFVGGDVFRAAIETPGRDGTMIVRPCADDPHGNSACADDVVIEVGEGGGSSGTDGGSGSDGSSGGGDTSGGGDASTSGADSTGADSTGTMPGTGSGSESASASGASATTPGPADGSGSDTGDTEPGASDDGDGGCGCRGGGSTPSLVFAVVVLFGLRRRAAR
jgi:hypothetical protein